MTLNSGFSSGVNVCLKNGNLIDLPSLLTKPTKKSMISRSTRCESIDPILFSVGFGFSAGSSAMLTSFWEQDSVVSRLFGSLVDKGTTPFSRSTDVIVENIVEVSMIVDICLPKELEGGNWSFEAGVERIVWRADERDGSDMNDLERLPPEYRRATPRTSSQSC